ncbi:MAG: YhcN/YlaJ family sporulation lipoprotein [Dehalobacterium sp.]
MKRTSLFVLFLALLLVMSMVVSACAPAQKPLPAPDRKLTPQQNNNVTQPVNNAQARANTIARACDAVPGVEASTVVISGNTAYVGLDLEGNLENSETDRVEKAASQKAIAADPAVTRCVVSSDADTVSRLKNIYQGVKKGTPISSFANELEEIGRRITPKVNR